MFSNDGWYLSHPSLHNALERVSTEVVRRLEGVVVSHLLSPTPSMAA